MTLIKCFTESHVDNITACLRLRPEKMILLGRGRELQAAVSRYRKFLKDRGLSTVVTAFDVGAEDYDSVCGALRILMGREKDPVIDLTGGDETVLMAVGAVVAEREAAGHKRIRVEKYDRKTDRVQDCLQRNRSYPENRAELRVEELLCLHGGGLVPDEAQPPAEFTLEDLDGLWKLVSKDPKGWNDAIKVLTEYERRSSGENKLHILVELASCDIQDPEKEQKARKLLNSLRQCGVLTDNSNGDKLDYTYRDSMMRCCTQKAGNVLELKTLLEARAMTENGVPFFQDARMGVNIDWDGIYYPPEEGKKETRNEIDVVLMHGTAPIFISCKNGNIGEEELYKLNTVARRFGGPYAGKMLVATKLDRKSEAANSSFKQRAWDMDILLVTDAAKLTSEQWQKHLKSALL